MRIIRYFPRAWSGDGGITRSVRHISEELVRAGVDVSIAVDEDRPFETNGGPSWLPVRHAGWARFRRPLELEEPLRRSDLLVMHSAWVYHNVHAAATARRLGVPYVLEPRGAYDPHILRRRRFLKRGWWWTLERRLVQEATAVHVFFESEREHLKALGYQGPVVVAPNGIDPPDVQWDGGSGGYLLWIGRFDPEHKGLDLLLHAMRLLPPDERPPLRLHGPDWAGGRAEVMKLVPELGLADWVTVGDPVYGDDKWELISRAAAFAYPSRWEGFGNSAAEAVAAGVPTLVTPYPLGRWLADRHAALMAAANSAALAAAIPRLFSPEASDLGRTGRELLREALGWGAIARSWLRQVEAAL